LHFPAWLLGPSFSAFPSSDVCPHGYTAEFYPCTVNVQMMLVLELVLQYHYQLEVKNTAYLCPVLVTGLSK